MAKRYSLAQVLELKHQLERQQMLVLARAELARQKQAERISSLAQSFEEQVDVAVSPELIDCRSMYLELQQADIREARGELLDMTEACDAARRELVLAALERKKLELHREAFQVCYRYEMQCKEQAEGDDVAQQIYMRQRMGAR